MESQYWGVEQLPIAECDPEKLSAIRLWRESFPAPPEEKAQLTLLLKTLRHHLQKKSTTTVRPEIFIQTTQLPRPGGAEILSKKASRWMPGLAMGVWPDREPPRSMVKQDFTHRLPGQKFPTLAHEARKILAKDERILLEVEEQMAGSGALLEVLAPEGWAAKEGKQVAGWLKDRIVDDAYRSYPAYVPLFDAESLTRLSYKDREACLAGIEVYLREDKANNSLLILSRTSFDETIAMMDSNLRPNS
jgi:hypothetical protein